MSNGEFIGPDSVDHDMWTPVRRVAQLPDSEFNQLLEALSVKHPTRAAMGEAAERVVTGMRPQELGEALGAIIGYIGGWMGAGRPGKLSVGDRAARRAFPDDADGAQRERVVALLDSPALWLSAGALDASQSRGMHIARVSVGVDLTPISWKGAPGTALAPSFPLNIDTYNPFTADINKRDTFVLDLVDLRSLRDEVAAAIEQLEQLRSSYAASGIMLWNITDEDDDDE